jgi:hypothetical protein
VIRNIVHTRISRKYGISRQVVFQTDDEQEAFAREKSLIVEHKTYIHGGAGWWGCKYDTRR